MEPSEISVGKCFIIEILKINVFCCYFGLNKEYGSV